MSAAARGKTTKKKDRKGPKPHQRLPTDPRPAKFDPDLLTVITCYFNPVQYDSRRKLHQMFAQHMRDAGVRLITVECALGRRPFEVTKPRHPDHVQVRANSVSWIKENLLNLGTARLADDCKYVAWIDGDIRFRDRHWATETIHALQHYDVVQPWSECYDLGPRGEHLSLQRSFARQYRKGVTRGKSYEFWHPGYAWAARRNALDAVGGLVDFAALGAGDHHMALAIIGHVRDSVPCRISAPYLRNLQIWQDRARIAFNQGNLGYVQGTIEHGFHGRKADRRYVDRWNIITRHQYDPDTDTRRNLYGVLELAGNKPRFRNDVDCYFRQRAEDANEA